MFFNPSTLIAMLSLASAATALAEPPYRSSLPPIRRGLASKLERRTQKLARQRGAQSSQTLDPAVISRGLAQNGQQNGGDPGQVPSLTSSNNFINFCLTQNVPLTDGKQIKDGSCNVVPMGRIIGQDKMPSSKFVNPKNGDTLAANTAFTIQMAVQNMNTGNFVNPQTNYYGAPQQVDNAGIVIAHSHVTVEALSSLDQTTPTDPRKFAFFKGLNAAAKGGILTADVTNGLPNGAYRMCSINSAANHQPVLVAVAQRGMLDDCVYFTVGGNGNGGNNGNNGNNGKGNAGSGSNGNNNNGNGGGRNKTGNNGGNTGNKGNGGGGFRGGSGGGKNAGSGGRNAGGRNAGRGGGSGRAGRGRNLDVAAETVTGNTHVGGNLQAFTGALGGAAPAVSANSGGFLIGGSSFANKNAALQRSCDVQMDACVGAAHSAGNRAPLTDGICETQQQACTAAIRG